MRNPIGECFTIDLNVPPYRLDVGVAQGFRIHLQSKHRLRVRVRILTESNMSCATKQLQASAIECDAHVGPALLFGTVRPLWKKGVNFVVLATHVLQSCSASVPHWDKDKDFQSVISV